jgi:ribonuclease P protein component
VRQTLRKSEILKGKKNFQEVFNRGKKIDGSILRCYVFQKSHTVGHKPGKATVAFVVSRTVRRAVDRNRIKRLMRESYRLNKNILPVQSPIATEHPTLVFLFLTKRRTGPSLPQYAEVETDMKSILNKICG